MLVRLAIVLAVAGLSRAQAGWSCDSLLQPNWDDCDSIESTIPWHDGPEPGNIAIKDGDCATFPSKDSKDNTKNCIISLCNYGNTVSASMTSFMRGDYLAVKNSCSPVDAGGEINPFGGKQKVTVTNNPDYEPPSRIKRAMAGKVTGRTTTTEEMEKKHEQAEEKARTKRLESQNARLNQNEKREDKWTTVAIYDYVRKPDEKSRVTPFLEGGAQYQWSVAKGYSTSVTTSVEVSAGFLDFFSASVGFSVTSEQSVTYTTTYTFDPTGRCKPEQTAVMYFYPLFKQYQGFQGDDQMNFIDVWIPIDGDNNSAMDVECLG